ncbi:alpha/beta fold hydrolase [Streptomyces sp. NPDC005963]|uniref:esterase/lipase family protein n=1 Tax=Streptomyces sp. NPDC005963 TaxID=3156721 RepID=UPI0033F1BF90
MPCPQTPPTTPDGESPDAEDERSTRRHARPEGAKSDPGAGTEPNDAKQGSRARRLDHPGPRNGSTAPRPRQSGRQKQAPRSGQSRTANRASLPAPERAPRKPRNSSRTQPERPPATPLPQRGDAQEHPPVVMLHGFADNRSVFVLLRRSLARHGWHHLECLNYSLLTCDIRAAADLLGRHIEEICERTGQSRVDIVGHSLGGLIARYYTQCLGGDLRVRTLVTLGTPHSGTTVIPLASAHPIVRQMRPGSSVIEELGRPAPGCRTRFISFWSDLDQLMAPVETARLDHPDLSATNVQISGVGHLALPVHPAVAAGIRRALEPDGSRVERDGSAGSAGSAGTASVA